MRLFFLPLNTGYVDGEVPSRAALRFYEARSGNGLHCAIVGNVLTPNGFGSNDVCMRISDRSEWVQLAHAISSQGALPGIQLATVWDAYVGNRGFKPRRGEDPAAVYRSAVENFSTKELRDVFEDLKMASDLALAAGFRHLQLHAAHGYLFSLLIDPAVSRLVEECLRLISDWIETLRGAGVESSVRVSMTAGHIDFDTCERLEVFKALVAIGPDYMDLSNGYYNFDKHLIYPSGPKEIVQRREGSILFACLFPAQEFIVSGRENLDARGLPPNVNIGICRDLIANPDFLKDGAVGCKNRMKCHFYSRRKTSLTCGEWPR